MDDREKLIKVISDIIAEGERFYNKTQSMLPDTEQLYREHNLVVKKLKSDNEHCRVRVVHEAMFKIHRKITSEHNQVMRKCNHILNRLATEEFNDLEIENALENYKLHYDRIVRENKLIELEQLKILREHKEFMSSLSED